MKYTYTQYICIMPSVASAVSRSSLRDFSLSLGTLIAFQLALVGVFSRISNMIYLNLCEVCVQGGRERGEVNCN